MNPLADVHHFKYYDRESKELIDRHNMHEVDYSSTTGRCLKFASSWVTFSDFQRTSSEALYTSAYVTYGTSDNYTGTPWTRV